ncbi:MAG: MobF family relaxase [Nitrospirota bacterium]|nr:MobF family relaxase [Nitrospirota bacterium]
MALGRNISPAQGAKYYLQDDYFMVREGGFEHRLEWLGQLSHDLGLVGLADPVEWERALSGFFPKGVTVRGGSRKDKDGRTSRRGGTDFEFSATKTISIVALIFGDVRLIHLHRHSSLIAIQVLEEHIGSRRGHAGRRWECTGCGLIGRVTHFTSRAGDPHLHDHFIFVNITKCRDGCYRSLSNDQMLHFQRLSQEIYFAELSAGLVKMGYAIEPGLYGEPQIKGLSRTIIEHFSQRGNDIEKFLKKKFGLVRTEATPELKKTVWKLTRNAKIAYELELIHAQWLARARAIGAERVLPGRAVVYSGQKRLEGARMALSNSLEEMTAVKSSLVEAELLKSALQKGRGILRYRDLVKAFSEELKSKELRQQMGIGRKPPLLLCRDAREREKRLLDMENSLDRHLPVLREDKSKKQKDLELAHSNDAALEKYLEHNAMNFIEMENFQERTRALSRAFCEHRQKNPLILTESRESQKTLNEQVRKDLGLSGKGREYRVFWAENPEGKDLKKIGTYTPEMEIRFLKSYPSLGLLVGTVAKVMEVNREDGTIRIACDGKSLVFEPRLYSRIGWELGTSESIELTGREAGQKGDRIRIIGNSFKKEGLLVGMHVEILKSEQDCLTIRGSKGEAIRLKTCQRFLNIDHAYSVTDISRNAIKDRMLILDLPSSSSLLDTLFPRLVQEESPMILITDNLEKLIKKLGAEKTLSLERIEKERDLGGGRRKDSER